MTNMQPFCFEGNEVRTVIEDGEPWFVAKDVCDVLGIAWKGSGTLGPLDEDEKDVSKVYTHGGEQEVSVISESGLYTLVIRSNKPQAKPFRRWVTHDVLPSIRKTGSYSILDKKEVNINHSRKTEAPGGLDIRYNLDLTKVVTKPTPAGLEILSRLTGISFADIDLGGNSLDHRATFQMFVEQCCVVGEDHKVKASDLYTAYLEWAKSDSSMSQPNFSTVAQSFFKKTKSSSMYYYGVDLI